MARVSIGIPVYNEEKFIRQTLISAFRQLDNYSDLEIILSDNCSTDDTLVEVERTIEQFSRHKTSIKFMKQRINKGASTNFWQTFDNSDSEFFLWLGAHDQLSNEFVAKAISCLSQKPDISMFSGTHKAMNETGKVFDDNINYQFTSENSIERYLDSILKLNNCYIFHSIFRRNLLIGYGRPDVPSADHILISRWLWSGKLFQSKDCFYVRRYFSADNRHQKKKDGNYVHSTNNIEFYDAYLSDFEKLISNLSPNIRKTLIGLASNMLMKRFGLPFLR